MVLDIPPQVSWIINAMNVVVFFNNIIILCTHTRFFFLTAGCSHILYDLFLWFQKKFPTDNLAEWNNGQPLGLRAVHAYVLVFDMGNLETFQVSDK